MGPWRPHLTLNVHNKKKTKKQKLKKGRVGWDGALLRPHLPKSKQKQTTRAKIRKGRVRWGGTLRAPHHLKLGKEKIAKKNAMQAPKQQQKERCWRETKPRCDRILSPITSQRKDNPWKCLFYRYFRRKPIGPLPKTLFCSAFLEKMQPDILQGKKQSHESTIENPFRWMCNNENTIFIVFWMYRNWQTQLSEPQKIKVKKWNPWKTNFYSVSSAINLARHFTSWNSYFCSASRAKLCALFSKVSMQRGHISNL